MTQLKNILKHSSVKPKNIFKHSPAVFWVTDDESFIVDDEESFVIIKDEDKLKNIEKN